MLKYIVIITICTRREKAEPNNKRFSATTSVVLKIDKFITNVIQKLRKTVSSTEIIILVSM